MIHTYKLKIITVSRLFFVTRKRKHVPYCRWKHFFDPQCKAPCNKANPPLRHSNNGPLGGFNPPLRHFLCFFSKKCLKSYFTFLKFFEKIFQKNDFEKKKYFLKRFRNKADRPAIRRNRWAWIPQIVTHYGRTDQQTDEQTNQQTDGPTDGQTDGRTQTDPLPHLKTGLC